MIYIDILKNKDEILERHYEDITIRKSVIEHLDEIKKYREVYNYLIIETNEKGNIVQKFNETSFKSLICAKSKSELIAQIDKIESLIELDSKNNRVSVENIRKDIEDSFKKCYENFSKRKWAFDFLDILGSDVCPYCNRNFTMSVYKKESKQKPEFDHYFPKSKYPYLSISILNLVPICSNCNKGKGNEYITNEVQEIMYPYEEQFGDDIKFTTDFDKIESWFDDSEYFKVILHGGESKIRDAYNKAFKIDELYTKHNDYVRELITKSIIFSDDFLISIYSCFPELFNSLNEVKELVYGNYLGKENYGKRPLAKMINDLLDEIKNN